ISWPSTCQQCGPLLCTILTLYTIVLPQSSVHFICRPAGHSAQCYARQQLWTDPGPWISSAAG
ncbi:hypothetical protein EI555_000677, partial [Monodon monoceros]